MARSDITRALDAVFHAAADVARAAADMRPVTPDEFRQQRALLALAARIRSDVARIGNERHEAATDNLSVATTPSLAEAA